MQKHPNLLIVVADGEHARFVRAAADYGLHTESAVDSATAHKQSSDLGADKPGAGFHTGSSAHHGVQPRHDPHALEKQKFAHFVAAKVNAEAAAGRFETLLLVAPAHTLGEIREMLSADAAGRVVGTLAKDLAKTPDHDLQAHLKEWVFPVARAH